MKIVRLGELISSSGRRAGDNELAPVYSVTKHSGFIPSLEYFKKQVYSRDLSSYRLVNQGEFAYATIHLDEGSIGIAPKKALISPMYTVFSVDKSRVDPGYLIRFMKSPQALIQYQQFGRGAIHRRKAISLKSLGALKTPLPPLDEQRRIAASPQYLTRPMPSVPSVANKPDNLTSLQRSCSSTHLAPPPHGRANGRWEQSATWPPRCTMAPRRKRATEGLGVFFVWETLQTMEVSTLPILSRSI